MIPLCVLEKNTSTALFTPSNIQSSHPLCCATIRFARIFKQQSTYQMHLHR